MVAPYSGAMLAMVARSGTARLRVPSPKNSTNLPTTLCLRRISVTVSTRSVAVHAFAQRAGELEADHVGRQEVDRLAQHRRLGLDAAHAPADHADAVDHGGVAVGADQRVGVAHAVLALVDAARQVLQVHLVHDAEAGRHHAEGVEGLHAPLHELVALAVALELQLHVQVERVLGAVVVDHDRVVDHQVHRHQRLDPADVLAQLAAPRCASPPGRPAAARR